MFRFIPFQRWHLLRMLAQPVNACFSQMQTSEATKHLEENCYTLTMLVNGKIVMCGGVVPYWTNRGKLWCIFDEQYAKESFVTVFKGIKQFLIDAPYKRLEMDIPCDNEFTDVAKRRAELLGFKLECERARCFFTTGADAMIYSLVRE